jgi:hypothetical protein
MDRGVPSLAIHPRDLQRGFWPKILRLTEELLEAGSEPVTPTALFQATDERVTEWQRERASDGARETKAPVRGNAEDDT